VRARVGIGGESERGGRGAAAGAGRIVFSAAEEDSDDPVEDARVAGYAIGILDAEGRVDAIEETIRRKVEGIHAEPAPGEAIDLLLVCDADNPGRRSPLLAARWERVRIGRARGAVGLKT
jgi:hypothetical protein